MAKETTSNSTKAIVGGSYRQVRRGTQDFGAMTENIEEAAKPGLGLLAERQGAKKQLKVDYDKSKSEYDADIDKTIGSIGTISGSESLSPLEQERAFKANAKLKEKLRLKLSQGAGTYAAATANKDAQGQKTVMENNESVLTQTNGVKEFVNAWSQPDVYHGEATDQTFDSNEFDSNGKPLPGLSLEYFVNANNTRPDSVDFEEGTTNDGEKKMMVSIVDDNGVKRFLDMDKFNDPETLAQTFRVRADVTTSLAEHQKQNPYINPVYETVKSSSFNDGQTMQYGSVTKTINENTQNVYKEGAARYASDFVNKNPSLLYSVYADMVKSNFKPEANEGGLALEGFDKNTVFEFGQMEEGSKFYGKMSDDYIEEFARKFNIANAVKDPPEPKLTLQEVKTKIHDAQKSMVENYLQQQALADTPGYELNDNGNAVLVDQLKDTSAVEQKETVTTTSANAFGTSMLSNVSSFVNTEVAGYGGGDMFKETVNVERFAAFMETNSKNNRKYIDATNPETIQLILQQQITDIENDDEIEDKAGEIATLNKEFRTAMSAKGGDSPLWYIDAVTGKLNPVNNFDGTVSGSINAILNDSGIPPSQQNEYREITRKMMIQGTDVATTSDNMEDVMIDNPEYDVFANPDVPKKVAAKIDGSRVADGNMNNPSPVGAINEEFTTRN